MNDSPQERVPEGNGSKNVKGRKKSFTNYSLKWKEMKGYEL